MTEGLKHMDREKAITDWKASLGRRGMLQEERDELEDHLLSIMNELTQKGLSSDEALIIALGRVGRTESIGAEFSRIHAGRIWKQLVSGSSGSERLLSAQSGKRTDPVRLLLLLQLFISQIPAFFGFPFNDQFADWYLINLNFLVFPVLYAYFYLRRKAGHTALALYGLLFLSAAVSVNFQLDLGSQETSSVALLAAIHLPLFFWLMLLPLYTGTDEWLQPERQFDFVRFTGETFIYAVLIGCGVIVTAASAAFLFETIGIEENEHIIRFLVIGIIPLIPFAASALVEAKGHLIENFAPVLARIFLPAFLLIMIGFLAVSWITGRAVSTERELLIFIDLLLALVLAMILYTASIDRNEHDAVGWDIVMLISSAAAVVIDAAALAAIAQRFARYGISPNRLAALGENILLLVNLCSLTVLFGLLLTGKIQRDKLFRIQGIFLACYALWFLFVSLAFPMMFS